jgi:hypothetical protein
MEGDLTFQKRNVTASGRLSQTRSVAPERDKLPAASGDTHNDCRHSKRLLQGTTGIVLRAAEHLCLP